MINIVFIGSFVLAAAIGGFLGFGKSLKVATHGIVGAIISVALCVLFGGGLMAANPINGLIDRLNEYFANLWGFLGVIRLGTIIYFICLFLIFQVLRIIIVNIIKQVTEADLKAVKILNKVGGALFLATFAFFFCMIILAGVWFIEGQGWVENPMAIFKGTFIEVLYINNPLVG